MAAPIEKSAFRALESATLWGARRALRNSSLWLPHAEQYGGRHRLLLPAARWLAVREAFVSRHGLPASVDEFISRTLAHMTSSCETLAAAVAAGELQIEKSGYVSLPLASDPWRFCSPRSAASTRLTKIDPLLDKASATRMPTHRALDR